MEDMTWWILNYRDRIEILAIVIAVITALSSFDDVFVDLYYWCLKLFGRQDEKDRALAKSVGGSGESSGAATRDHGAGVARA